MNWSTSSICNLLALAALAVACNVEGSSEGAERTGAPRFGVLANVEKSAFVGLWDGELSGQYDNRDAYEVASYAGLFVRGRNLIVTQNNSSDEILRFTVDDSGALRPGGSLLTDPQSLPNAVVFDTPSLAYVSCLNSGKVLAFDPNDMSLLGTIELAGKGLGAGEEDMADDNPDPGAMALRDGRLYVTLAQKKNQVLSHPGMQVAVVDPGTYEVESVIEDPRLAQSGGEIDRIYLDEEGDLYVYGGASYGFDPTQSHGFLRIRQGESVFDPDYEFDLGALELDVPGGRIDYLNHMIYGGDGIAYAFANVPGLASNPPDYVNDHTFQAVELDLHKKTIRLLPLPHSNGYSGTIALDGSRLIASIASPAGVGFYAYDVESGEGSARPLVTTAGYVSQLVELE
jgi:hypothetical protein